MAESNNLPNNISANDTLDINELAALDEDITPDFIEQLQSQIAGGANVKNDGDLFEDVPSNASKKSSSSGMDGEDDFAKKYKAKLLKRQGGGVNKEAEEAKNKTDEVLKAAEQELASSVEAETKKIPQEATQEAVQEVSQESSASEQAADKTVEIKAEVKNDDVEEVKEGNDIINSEKLPEAKPNENTESINAISGGNITERPISQDQATYREGLNYIDNNVKYSKYVIYIDPENKDFIDSLTVKERKNLINRIIKEQDAIALTKRRLNKMQTIIFHTIVIIITLTLSVPIIYWLINTSLEVTINNYRQSQSTFEVLYKEHGKLKKN